MKSLLIPYRKKRDFKKTPEPSGLKKVVGKRRLPSFVIQKHAASHLHYDFRLEDEGVLKSWAVPKGPSLDPSVKRLAMPTEDHPLDYGSFEGIIPKGQYGGGTVIVWDNGVFVNLSEKGGHVVPLVDALRKGHAKFWLEGKKLQGLFALTRMGSGDRPPWVYARPGGEPTARKTRSVLSGLTIEEMSRAA
jgi:DNA ligase D-like protein (predicted 3'-phosphoesterase)